MSKKSIIHAKLTAWHNSFKQHKSCKRYKQRINACGMASNNMVDWCLPENDKKEIDLFFSDKS